MLVAGSERACAAERETGGHVVTIDDLRNPFQREALAKQHTEERMRSAETVRARRRFVPGRARSGPAAVSKRLKTLADCKAAYRVQA